MILKLLVSDCSYKKGVFEISPGTNLILSIFLDTSFDAVMAFNEKRDFSFLLLGSVEFEICDCREDLGFLCPYLFS